MEAAHGNVDAGLAERSCNIESARILVRLDTGQCDEAEVTVGSEAGEERRHVDARVRLVDHLDIDGDFRSEYPPLGAICCNSVDGGKRVRGNHRPPPANYVSVVIVVRRLDQNELKAPLRGHGTVLAQSCCNAAMSASGQTRSFGDVGPVSGLPESGHGWAIYEPAVGGRAERPNRDRGESRDSSPPTPPDVRVRIRRFGGLSRPRHRDGSQAKGPQGASG